MIDISFSSYLQRWLAMDQNFLDDFLKERRENVAEREIDVAKKEMEIEVARKEVGRWKHIALRLSEGVEDIDECALSSGTEIQLISERVNIDVEDLEGFIAHYIRWKKIVRKVFKIP